MATNTNLLGKYTSPVRKIGAKMELASGDEVITFTEQDNLKSARVERVGDESKFFGYGVCQKLNIKALDINKEFAITTAHKGQLSFSVNDEAYNVASPVFQVSETHRDEVTGELSITAYDLLKKAANFTVNDLDLVAPYTIRDVVTLIGAKLGAKDTLVASATANLAKPIAKWELKNGAYIDGDYIVLPEESSSASVIIDWNKRSDKFYVSAIADSTEANYRVYASTVYYDANGNSLSANGSSKADLNGENLFEWVGRYTDTSQYTEAIKNAVKIKISFSRGTSTAPKAYKIKNIMFCINSTPFVAYRNTCFDSNYEDGANFDGTETLQEVLIAAAEATYTIYYVNSNNELVFRRLVNAGNGLFTVNKERYIELDSSTNRKLTRIVSVTELGDNIEANTGEIGSTQYVRNNPFWENRSNIAALLKNAIAAVGGLTINQFTCSWRGFPFLEVGDKLSFTTKENNLVTSFVLNDVIEYNGALTEKMQWKYTDNDNETEANPVGLGEALKATFAKVDKANKEITLLASETEANKSALSSLRINTDSIAASVKKIEENTSGAIGSIADDVAKLTSEIETKMTSEEVSIAVKKELENGTDKVTTKTGFTFNDDGLTVEKSNSEMKTQITEDGMKVFKNDEEVLTANNIGVNAVNLHATTYLIIGTNSRFEDYGSNRTGCFWIGGKS